MIGSGSPLGPEGESAPNYLHGVGGVTFYRSLFRNIPRPCKYRSPSSSWGSPIVTSGIPLGVGSGVGRPFSVGGEER